MNKTLLIIIASIAIAACATAQPMVVGCAVKLPPAPHYPVSDLKLGDEPAAVGKAYVASLGIAMDDDRMVRREIKECT